MIRIERTDRRRQIPGRAEIHEDCQELHPVPQQRMRPSLSPSPSTTVPAHLPRTNAQQCA